MLLETSHAKISSCLKLNSELFSYIARLYTFTFFSIFYYHFILPRWANCCSRLLFLSSPASLAAIFIGNYLLKAYDDGVCARFDFVCFFHISYTARAYSLISAENTRWYTFISSIAFHYHFYSKIRLQIDTMMRGAMHYVRLFISLIDYIFSCFRRFHISMPIFITNIIWCLSIRHSMMLDFSTLCYIFSH